MSDFGVMFRADDGSLLVTSDTPCYEFVGEVSPSSRSGNVSKYEISTNACPLLFVNCGVGNSGGVLAIEGSSGRWVASVLSNVRCNVSVFIPIANVEPNGFGVAIYDANARLVFDSSRKILNATAIAPLNTGAQFSAPAGTDMVCYTSGQVKPNKTVSEVWTLIEAYQYLNSVYTCRYEYQNICSYSMQTVCGYNYVCNSVYVCTFIGGFYSCYYAYSCDQVYSCSQVSVYSCTYTQVQVCGFENVINYAEIHALVRTTNWSIDRGCAKINDNSTVSFNWVNHQSGYYKEIVRYATYGYSQSLSGAQLPIGYVAPTVFITSNTAYEGALTKDNTFPYTSSIENSIALACITTKKDHYG